MGIDFQSQVDSVGVGLLPKMSRYLTMFTGLLVINTKPLSDINRRIMNRLYQFIWFEIYILKIFVVSLFYMLHETSQPLKGCLTLRLFGLDFEGWPSPWGCQHNWWESVTERGSIHFFIEISLWPGLSSPRSFRSIKIRIKKARLTLGCSAEVHISTSWHIHIFTSSFIISQPLTWLDYRPPSAEQKT